MFVDYYVRNKTEPKILLYFNFNSRIHHNKLIFILKKRVFFYGVGRMNFILVRNILNF